MKFEKFKFKNHKKVVEFTCDKSRLANFFGQNPKAPHFLTPIFFKKEVLSKYYNKPSKYSVVDGSLSCGMKWMIRIDNNAKDCVMVYLGDLGDLPYGEQQHWKVHNTPQGNMSNVAFERDFKAKFSSPTEPALFFKERFSVFNKRWKDKFRWSLFKPLHKEDEHHIKSLKIPGNEQKEFDEVILSLNKLLIDSINVSKMKKQLDFDKNDKSISIFEKYLNQKYNLIIPNIFKFLRNLQELRSKGSAHRKGRDYKLIYKKLNKGNFSRTFRYILSQSIKMLDLLEEKILKV